MTMSDITTISSMSVNPRSRFHALGDLSVFRSTFTFYQSR
jgi:hypothetical protein